MSLIKVTAGADIEQGSFVYIKGGKVYPLRKKRDGIILSVGNHSVYVLDTRNPEGHVRVHCSKDRRVNWSSPDQYVREFCTISKNCICKPIKEECHAT